MSLATDRWPRIFPVSGRNPGGGNDTLWLNLKVKKLEKQTYHARDKGGIITGATNIDEMSFLMPIEFTETLNHDWEEHQNWASAIAEKVKLAAQAGSDVYAATRLMKNYETALKSTNVAKIKPDTPLVYRGSGRREIPIDLQLADQGDIEYDVMEPINRLREYSSAMNSGNLFTIEFPHIFELSTVTGTGKSVDIITMKYAALRSVQPGFRGPYRSGYPSRCELTLTFVDMEPVYRDTFKKDRRVTTSYSTDTRPQTIGINGI